MRYPYQTCPHRQLAPRAPRSPSLQADSITDKSSRYSFIFYIVSSPVLTQYLRHMTHVRVGTNFRRVRGPIICSRSTIGLSHELLLPEILARLFHTFSRAMRRYLLLFYDVRSAVLSLITTPFPAQQGTLARQPHCSRSSKPSTSPPLFFEIFSTQDIINYHGSTPLPCWHCC